MKRIYLIVVISLLCANVFSQAGVKIFTKLDDAKFKITFNGELENTIRIKSISYDSLDYKKKYSIRLSFEGDTIADIDKKILIYKDKTRVFEILKKKDVRKQFSAIGRNIGKLLNRGNHDKDKVLYDVFYLKERTYSKDVDE